MPKYILLIFRAFPSAMPGIMNKKILSNKFAAKNFFWRDVVKILLFTTIKNGNMVIMIIIIIIVIVD